jgi:lysozyme family protein
MGKINTIDKALEFVLKWEGGYVNDPDDAGGETKYGIAKRFFPHLNIKDLTLEQAKEIYDSQYWTRSGCPWIEDYNLATAVFDTAVNCGVGFAVNALELAENNLDKFLELRKQRYFNIITKNPTNRKFRRGWANRVNSLAELVGSRVRWVTEDIQSNSDKPQVKNNKKQL